jgi:hypothetical protein
MKHSPFCSVVPCSCSPAVAHADGEVRRVRRTEVTVAEIATHDGAALRIVTEFTTEISRVDAEDEDYR